jgi:glycosyltransferase involved in cell wall biosynthesis
MKFSVLMSIYYKEQPEYFNRAMLSIWDDQTIRPGEIVLIEDGPLSKELYMVIKSWKVKLGNSLIIIHLENNLGLGRALNIGLERCSYDLVARMDTDDICRQDRFEKQLLLFSGGDVDICSSWVGEFYKNEKEIVSCKKLPELHDDIVEFGKKRCPMNHPAVMYRKSTVLEVGGYGEYRFSQDYHLWVRMILNGAKLYNIQECLVNMRVGHSMLNRRGGVNYAINEINLQYKFLGFGLITIFRFILNLLIRIPVRLLPNRLRYFVYKIIRS